MSDRQGHRRSEVARAVDDRLGSDGVVFCGLGSGSRAWRELESERPTYYASDPMGLALPLAAGFALARPAQPVVLLVGDGDLLMGLGALVSVAAAAPANLRVVVLDNARYETGGGRSRPGGRGLDLAAVATDAGWAGAASGERLAPAIGDLLAGPGPALLVVPVMTEAAPYGGAGRWSGAEERVVFELRLAQASKARRPRGE